jgi:hypothetical protein
LELRFHNLGRDLPVALDVGSLEIDGVCRHELRAVLVGAVAPPVDLEHLGVKVELVPVALEQVGVLGDGAHYLREEGGIIIVEEVEAQRQVLGEGVKLLGGQIPVVLLIDGVTELICYQKLSRELLSCRLLWPVN